MSVSIVVRDTADNPCIFFEVGKVTPGVVSSSFTRRFYNAGDQTPAEVEIGVLTVKFNPSGDRDSAGQEVVTEKWVEAREGAGAWTPIGGDPLTPGDVMSITPPAPGAYTEIEFRLNPPSGATTKGLFAFFPFNLHPEAGS